MNRKLFERAFDKAVLKLPLTDEERAALDTVLYGRPLVPPAPWERQRKKKRVK